jgi:WD40 repeat protein
MLQGRGQADQFPAGRQRTFPVGILLANRGQQMPGRIIRPTPVVAFSPDGKTVLTGSMDKTARLWRVQPPLEGAVEQITLWLAVRTGTELDEDGVVHVLDAETWQKHRQRLQTEGGPLAER